MFKAQERATGRLVAVKVVPLSEGDDPADLAKEIELLAACDHPNVVRYLVSAAAAGACQYEQLHNWRQELCNPAFERLPP